MMNLHNNYNTTGHKGQLINCQALNTGFFAAQRSLEKTGWVGFGGDADNDFAGNYHGTYLSYGRKTGFGGGGELKRGVRVFDLERKVHGPFKISAYVLDEDGNKNVDMGMYEPPFFRFTHQRMCGVDKISSLFNADN